LLDDLLNALDGITFVMQQPANATQKFDVVGPVISPTATPLHGLDLSEFAFPKPQDVLWDFEFIGNFADGAEGFCGFLHVHFLPEFCS
jgi:hypothetical protein